MSPPHLHTPFVFFPSIFNVTSPAHPRWTDHRSNGQNIDRWSLTEEKDLGHWNGDHLLTQVISKEAVGNSWDILYAILGHKLSSKSSKQGDTKRINPTFATENEFYHICVLQCAYAPFRHFQWSTSSFWITVHASWVPTSAKQTITHLETVIKVTFVANVGFIR